MDKLQWNEELYKRIEDKVNENMPIFELKNEYNILDEKYTNLVKTIEEEYYVHPDGPYEGSKSEQKKIKNTLASH